MTNEPALSLRSYDKQRIALRYWLLGAGYDRAVEAMTFAEGHHDGFRKDGITPEFSHQVQIAAHVRTYAKQLRFPEETIMVALLHDVAEDYGVSIEEIRSRFGSPVAEGVDRMIKEFRGVRRDDVDVFAGIAQNELACVVKLCDRHHNLGSALGVFSSEKLRNYVAEGRQIVTAIVKPARRTFPHLEPVLEGLKLSLETQMRLLEAVLDAQSTSR